MQSGALNKLFFAMVSVASEVFSRMRAPYNRWPWKLAKIVDPRLCADSRRAVAEAFFKSRNCCLDFSFGERLKSAMDQPSDILEDGKLHSSIQLLSMQKVHNIEIEDNFARSTQMRAASKGLVQDCINFANR